MEDKRMNEEKIHQTIKEDLNYFFDFEDINEAIDFFLEDIGKLTGASRVHVLLLRGNANLMDNTHEWCAPGVKPQKEKLQNISTTSLTWWGNKIQKEKYVQVEDVTKLPEEAIKEIESLGLLENKSVLIFPIYIGAELVGSIGIDNASEITKWRKEDIMLLNLVSKIFGNVIKRKRVEKALRASEETLKIKNNELTAALSLLKQTQAQLIHNEKLAGIGQLAAGVAHEINNPLGFVLSNFDMLKKYITQLSSVIEGYTQLKETIIQKDIIDLKIELNEINNLEKKNHLNFILGDLEDLIKESMGGLKRVEEIVKGLRMFSRVDQINEIEEYDLNLGIKTTVLVARNEIKYHAVIEEMLGDIPMIIANGGKINQVLLNIIVNAAHAIKAKSTEEPGIIKIRTYEEGANVICEIEDNGIGIEKKNLQKIFDPFFTTKQLGEGTGLGLSIAYEIITAHHNGEILVDSETDVGTKFIIKIPKNYKYIK